MKLNIQLNILIYVKYFFGEVTFYDELTSITKT